MSLLDEFKELLEENRSANAWEARNWFSDDPEVGVVSEEYLSSGRWTEVHQAVFRRRTLDGDEYVALLYELPATEYQEGSESPSEVFEVRPHKVTVVKYVPVDTPTSVW